MDFERFFKIISYAVIFCGFFSLFAAGGAGLISTIFFLIILVSAWFFEDSRRQISEKVGTLAIFIVVPLFYLDREYQIIGFGGSVVDWAAMLARMILVLTAIKLLQRKTDRDWLFLYLMAFFEVLLAAGLSISPLYLISLILYLLTAICAIVAFEIRKTSASLQITKKKANSSHKLNSFSKFTSSRLPVTAFSLLTLIVITAAPLFFALPRVGGAGSGSNSGNISNMTGFSDSVNLGEIGQLLQNDQVVMRVRLENTDGKNAYGLKWRGIALDTFDNKRWSKSENYFSEALVKRDGNSYKVAEASNLENLTAQTVYLEPLDSQVLFTLAHPVAVQGNFQILKRDSEDALSYSGNNNERQSYRVISDTNLPHIKLLKSDNAAYSPDYKQYLQLPEKFDGRIAALAKNITAKYNNRFDKSKAVEEYLQTQFGYNLDMKAGGDEPLADFLFNVREGHCEYFASAMAIMLRTQGIATRIINGFHQGEYNETADVFLVKQKDAHSWVEVYFPENDSWIPFDPTPFAAQDGGAGQFGIIGKFNHYLEALETFWIQYFVSYDNQGQRSLMRSVKNSFVEHQAKTSVWLNELKNQLSNWWHEARGDKGLQTSAKAVAFGIGYLLAVIFGIIFIVWLYRKIIKLAIWQKVLAWLKYKKEATIVEFYERMQKVLASKGFTRQSHQTPLEFAFALDMPEAVKITEKYNRVRFGEKNLSGVEAEEIERWLEKLENNITEATKK